MTGCNAGSRWMRAVRSECRAVWADLADPRTAKEPVTITTVVVVVVIVAALAFVAYGIYKLVQLVRGSGTTATRSRLDVTHDDAVIANAAGKKITAVLTRQIDGNPMPSIDIKFEISGGNTPEITSAIDGATTATRTTDFDGKAEVTIVGTGNGADVCSVSLALGGSPVLVTYETTGP